MLKIESCIGIIRESEEKIYTFLSDFNNFRDLVPENRVKNWESTADSCNFNVEGIGSVGLRILEKEPNKLIKISSDGNKPVPFFVWFQIKEVAEKDSRIKITAEVEVNPLMAAMVKGPLKLFVDSLIEQAEKMKLW
jgi:carbon monoxide dehydrogenase subunit G